MSYLKITKENFKEEVLESEKPVLLDFFADWCGPCKMIAPIIEEIANERPDIKVGKVDVTAEEELAAAFNVFSIPTVIVMKDGKLANQTLGYHTKDELLGLLK